MNRRSLDCELNSLVIFRSLLDDEIIKNFQSLLGLETDEVDCRVYNYSDFVSLLYKENVNFSEYILKRVLENENLYIEGDNLEVLKLLQESYLGKVKTTEPDPLAELEV